MWPINAALTALSDSNVGCSVRHTTLRKRRASGSCAGRVRPMTRRRDCGRRWASDGRVAADEGVGHCQHGVGSPRPPRCQPGRPAWRRRRADREPRPSRRPLGLAVPGEDLGELDAGEFRQESGEFEPPRGADQPGVATERARVVAGVVAHRIGERFPGAQVPGRTRRTGATWRCRTPRCCANTAGSTRGLAATRAIASLWATPTRPVGPRVGPLWEVDRGAGPDPSVRLGPWSTLLEERLGVEVALQRCSASTAPVTLVVAASTMRLACSTPSTSVSRRLRIEAHRDDRRQSIDRSHGSGDQSGDISTAVGVPGQGSLAGLEGKRGHRLGTWKRSPRSPPRVEVRDARSRSGGPSLRSSSGCCSDVRSWVLTRGCHRVPMSKGTFVLGPYRQSVASSVRSEFTQLVRRRRSGRGG